MTINPQEGDPVFETRAELEAWVADQARSVRWAGPQTKLALIEKLRRVTLAHLRATTTKAPPQ